MTPGVFARTYAAKYPGDLFARIRADGFSAVQFNLSCAGLAALPETFPPGIGKSIARAAGEAGLALCALSGTYNMAHPDMAQRKRDRSGFENVMRVARDMDVSLVSLCTGSRDVANMWRAHPDNGSGEAWSALRGELISRFRWLRSSISSSASNRSRAMSLQTRSSPARYSMKRARNVSALCSMRQISFHPRRSPDKPRSSLRRQNFSVAACFSCMPRTSIVMVSSCPRARAQSIFRHLLHG